MTPLDAPADSGPDPFTEFIERASSEMVAQGFPRMPARVLMALTATEDGKATAEELAATLEASPAAISGAVKYLGVVGFVRNTTLPGTRKHVYSLSNTPWYATSFTRTQLYAQIENSMRTSTDRMPADSGARARIEEVADFFSFMQRRLPGLLDDWNAERAATGNSVPLRPEG
jgi:DNA-binding transcriptional regulator GbsR (MarR family)